MNKKRDRAGQYELIKSRGDKRQSFSTKFDVTCLSFPLSLFASSYCNFQGKVENKGLRTIAEESFAAAMRLAQSRQVSARRTTPKLKLRSIPYFIVYFLFYK